MFGRKKNSARDVPEGFRTDARRSDTKLDVYIDGKHAVLMDYSHGGVRVGAAPAVTRRVVVVEVYRGRNLVERVPAVVAWKRDGETGYSFRRNLKLYEIESELQLHPEERNRNETGAVAGNALRDRLKI